MKLLTIVLNWRTPDMTLDAVGAALRECQWVKGDWKVLIVDNDSQDGSFDAMTKGVRERREEDGAWRRVEVLQSGHNGGFGAGNNFGIRHGLQSDDPPEYVYILNSDAFPEEGAIRKLADHLDAHRAVGVVGSYLHGTDGEPHVSAFRFPSIQSEIEGSVRFGPLSKLFADRVVPIGIPEGSSEVDWLAGASFMVRRSVLERVGLFDESFFLYFEETDLCQRIRRAGWKVVYVRESSVAHIGSVSTGMRKWSKTPTYWYDSRRHYFLKNHGRAYLAAATAARVVGTGVWQLRRLVQGKEEADPPGFLPDLVKHSLAHLKKELTPR